MDDNERSRFDLLVKVIDEELRAQRAMARTEEQIPALVADAVWRTFRVLDR